MVQFKDVIQSEDQFRSVMGEPGSRVLAKSIYHLDAHSIAFIQKCPFLMLSSSSADGHLTISPKGDPAGFVQVMDAKTLLIPERLGNQRAETFKNILHNPNVGVIFVVPGKGETLRISGQAQIVRDEQLRQEFEIKGRAPDFLIAVNVGEVYFHCGKSMQRSRIWRPEDWPDISGLASLAETMVDAGQLDDSKEAMQKIVSDDARDRLY